MQLILMRVEAKVFSRLVTFRRLCSLRVLKVTVPAPETWTCTLAVL